MKKKILVLIVLSLIGFNAYGAEPKFAYVDLNRALNESNEGKEAITALEEMVKSKQVGIDEMGEEIKALEDDIAKQSSVLTPESISAKTEQHEKLLRDYQRIVQDTQSEIQRKQTEFMKNIISDLRETIIAIGEEEKYTAIFETAESGLLYMPKDLDITDLVIRRFNKEEIRQSGKKQTLRQPRKKQPLRRTGKLGESEEYRQ